MPELVTTPSISIEGLLGRLVPLKETKDALELIISWYLFSDGLVLCLFQKHAYFYIVFSVSHLYLSKTECAALIFSQTLISPYGSCFIKSAITSLKSGTRWDLKE